MLTWYENIWTKWCLVCPQELVMDILRVLAAPDLEVRKKTLNLTMELVTSRTVEEVIQVKSCAQPMHWWISFVFVVCFSLSLSAGLPSHGGDVTVYVWHKPTELAHSFLLCSCVYSCLRGPFNCISFHKFSRQLSAYSLCCSLFSVSGLIDR